MVEEKQAVDRQPQGSTDRKVAYDIPIVAQELTAHPENARGFLRIFKQITVASQLFAEQISTAWAETPEQTVDAAKRMVWLILNNGNPTPEAEAAFQTACQTNDTKAVEYALNALEQSYRHPEPKMPEDMKEPGLVPWLKAVGPFVISSVVETKQYLLDNGALKGWYKETMKDLIEEAAKKGMVVA